MSDFFNTGLYKIFEPKYKDIIGKPFITVSAKGISNGLSNIPNDGADFGPDTTLGASSPNQTGPPYTQTLGWQEAINYAETNGIGKIVSKPNRVYILSNPVYFNPNGNYTFPLEIDGQNSTIKISSSTLALNPFQINNNPNSNAGVEMYPLKLHGFIFDGNSTNSNSETIEFNQYGYNGNDYTNLVEIYGNEFTNGSVSSIFVGNQSFSLSIHDNIFSNIGLSGPISINGQNQNCYLNIYSNIFIAGALSAGSNAILLNNNNQNTSITSPAQNAVIIGNYFGNTSNAPTSGISNVIIHGSSSGTGTGWNSAIISENIFDCTAGWQNTIGGVGLGGFNINVINNICPVGFTTSLTDCVISNNMIMSGLSIYLNANIKNNRIYNPTTGYNAIGIAASNSQYIVIDSNIIDSNGTNNAIQISPTTVTGSSYIIKNNVFKGSNITISALPASSLFYDNKTLTGNYPIEPTTPAVPASATAQENTNPYPVNVYLYGGTVTEIQVTKNGTAYTVFSNASGLALSGQVYKLNPSDSITITYTTAPTWEWLSD